MGFWSGLGKVLQGKHVFETPVSSQHAPDEDASQAEVHTAANAGNERSSTSGPKILPTVLIERSDSHINGSHIRVMAHIKNHSDQQVELDKIRLLGVSTELDTVLRPGESREFRVYEGPGMNGSGYDDAHVIYKDMTGDYFETYHTVQFRKEKDGTYSPQQFRFIGPVKDI